MTRKQCKYDYVYELDRLEKALTAAKSLLSPLATDDRLTIRHRGSGANRRSYVYKRAKRADGTYASVYQKRAVMAEDQDLINNFCAEKVTNKVKYLKKVLHVAPETYDRFEIQRLYEDLYDAFGEFTPAAFLPNSIQIKKWLSQKIPRNYFPEQLNKPTDRGDMVRSKYEQMIANVLYELEIPYLYEKPKVFNNVSYLPDFTLIDPQNGSLAYVEAFGMMEDPAYAKSCVKKIHDYEASSLIQGKDLFLVFDDPDSPFDPASFRKLMKSRFF